DVDGDGINDIVFGTLDGRISVLSMDGSRIKDIAGTPAYTHLTEEFDQLVSKPVPASILQGTPAIAERWGHSAIAAPPAIADLDGDGTNEIVVVTLNGLIYAAHFDGTFMPGYNPITLPVLNCADSANLEECEAALSHVRRGASSSPVIADVDGDGQLDVVVAAHDGRVHAYDRAGKPLPGWPVLIPVGQDAQPGALTRSPAVGDFNGDSVSDLLVTVGEQHSRNFGRGLAVVVLGGRAPEPPRIADGWPVGVDTYDLEVDRLDRSTPGGAVDSSSAAPRALIYGNSSQPFFVPLLPGVTQETDPATRAGQLPSAAEPISSLDGRLGFDLTGYGTQSEFGGQSAFAPMLARPSLGDLDRDGQVDVVVPGIPLSTLDRLRNNNNDADHLAEVAFFSGATGQMLPSAPITLESLIGATGATIADLTNDGYPEVILPNGAGAILAVDACGRTAPGWPKWVGGSVSGAAAVADIDGDELLDVVITTEEGWVYAWRTKGAASSYVPWGSELADANNTSSYQAVGDSVTPAMVWPLPLDASGQCSKTGPLPANDPRSMHEISARGGCECEMTTRSRTRAWSLMLLGLCIYLGRRRKRAEHAGS
ncbi:MAG TPA: VCBS repeat-containing protein, partial [Polyangiaceae bacterium]